jgi:hypothetical protein
MPSRRGPGDQDLQRALADLTSALNATGVPWMVIGGIAVIARGVRRMTTDIDAAVRGDQADLATLVAALAKKRIVPRIDDVERFARTSLVLLLKHRATGVELDVSMAWTDFEHEAIAASSVAAFGAVKAPMAQAEDLVIFKVIAGRPKDIEDATTLLVLYPEMDRARLRARVSQLAELADEPALTGGLDAAIGASGKHPVLIRAPQKRRRPRGKAESQPRRAGRTRSKKTR